MAAAAARGDGQEKVIAVAKHIVSSLASSKNAAEDMIRILSGFDNRLSTINDLLPPSADDGGGCPDGDGFGASEAELRLEAAEKVILRWDASDSFVWESSSPDDAEEYLAAVGDLIRLTGYKTSPGGCSGSVGDLVNRAEIALQMAMSRLEEEFSNLMVRNAVPLDPNDLSSSIRRLSISFASDIGEPIEYFESSVEDENQHHQQQQQQQSPQQHQEGSPEHRSGRSLVDERSLDLIHPEVVPELTAIAELMIWAKYDRELHQVYCTVRRDILEECISILGIDRMSIEEVQRIEWKMLDDKMKKWIQALKIVVRVMLWGEKRLCDQILASSEELKEECFTETVKGSVMQLLNFGDAITICQRSAEKLFRILDMYEVLADVLPDLQTLFIGDSEDLVCVEAEGVLHRLGDAAKGTLMEFGSAIQRESSRKPTQWCEIHPMTRYVMNYVRLLAEYMNTINLLLDDGTTSSDQGNSEAHDNRNTDGETFESTTPLGRHMVLTISYLESNLDEKSKIYEDGAMQYVFLMNNILYIVNKVKDSDLGKLLGDHWIRKRRSQIRQYATAYLRTSWTKVLSCLKDEGMGSGSSSSVSKVTLKEKFKSFNLAFEEIYRVQTTWKVPDPQLQEELRISISERVIPAYRAFMGRYGSQLDGGRYATKYIKYTPDDLESQLSDLFEGLSGATPKKKT